MLGGIVRGKLVTLRTPLESDLAAVNAWMADLRVRRSGHVWDEPAMPETWKERLKEAAKAERPILWVVEADSKPAGAIQVEMWHDPALGVSIRFFFIDPEVWRRGYGWDAALALHRYCFDYLDLRIAEVSLPADGAAGVRIAERLGYREFARGHEVYFRDGAYTDQVQMRFDRAVWDERFGATEREYAPFPEGIAR